MPTTSSARSWLSSCFCASLLLAAPAFPAHASLISQWQAEGDATDSAGGGNNGTAFGTLTYGPGVFGSAFVLNGSSGITITKQANLNMLGGDFTVSGWVKTAATYSNIGTIFLNYAGLDTYFTNINSAGTAEFSIRDSSGNAIDLLGTTSLTDGIWHNVVGVRSGQTGLLYVDGSLQASTTNNALGSINTTCTYALIGYSNTGPGNCTSSGPGDSTSFFNGSIDDVRIYNNALSAAEIEALTSVPEPLPIATLAVWLAAFAWIKRRSRV